MSLSSPDGEPPLVDAHFHIYTTDLPLAEGAWHRPPEDAGVDRLIRTLDDHGVLFGVVAAASLHGDYNDHVRRALQQHRRLRATAILRPETDIRLMEQMQREGFVGIRLMWRKLDQAPAIMGPEYQRFLRRVADLNWHVHVLDRADRLDHTIRGVEAAGARVVVDHLSMPAAGAGFDDPCFRATLDALDRGRSWVKISAGYRFQPPQDAIPFARKLVEATGGERLVWASDWPFAAFESTMTYARAIADFCDQVPDAAMRRRISGRNALELYFT